MYDDLTMELPFADFDGTGPLILSDPDRVFHACRIDEVIPALTEAQSAADDGCIVAGFFSYEAGCAFERALVSSPPSEFPLVYLGAFRHIRSAPLQCSGQDECVGPWTPDIDREQYDRAIAAIKDEIAAGNAYQVNYTYRLHAPFRGDPYRWYRRLVRERHGSYPAFLKFGPYAIISASPELLFRWEHDRIVTKPMKGTERRGYWPEDDECRFTRLSRSVKDRAENVMILDLMRNDIGRIAALGSVHVSDPFSIERLPTVFQMTSTVTGDVSPATTLLDIFAALFPGGSVTGAPKISAMNIIRRLETSPREVYCGAIGALFPNRPAIFNLAIRTVTVNQDRGIAKIGVGGGITWDSAAASEFEETIVKSRFATQRRPDFRLLETMRLEDGAIYLLNRHLARLARSVNYFGFSYDLNALGTHLAELATRHRVGTWRLRLTVASNGEFALECNPLILDESVQCVRICERPIDIETPFVYHKTTFRNFYDERKAMYPDAFDVLLKNPAGRYTEFTIGNLVIERDGRFTTPPISEGLLPGTMREELLDRGEILEAVVTEDDVQNAEQVWLINSVRKWVPVEIVPAIG